MKRNSLLAKSLTLGLAVATAAASMSVPGGLVAPVTAYAEDGIAAQTDAVTIAGTVKVGEQLTATLETTNDDAVYAWYRVNAEIEDAAGAETGLTALSTEKTYTLTTADHGSKILLVVKASSGAEAEETGRMLTNVVEFEDLPSDSKIKYDGEETAASDGYNDDVTITAETNDSTAYYIADAPSKLNDSPTSYSLTKPDQDYNTYSRMLFFKLGGNDKIYQKEITVKFDVTAPILSDIADPTALVADSATISVTSSEAGNVYYSCVASGAEAPDADAIVTGNQKEEVTTGGTPVSIDLTSLTANTSYDVYAVAKDAAGNLSEVKTVSFTTKKAACTTIAPVAGTFTADGRTLTFTVEVDKAAKDYDYSLDAGDNWTNGAENGSILTISGTTATLTLPNQAYEANVICLRVAETDAEKAGTSVPYTQKITATLEGTVTVSGTEKFGETITATVTGAQEGAELKYEFFRVKDEVATSCGTASTTNTYTLVKDDIGCTIKVKVTATGYTEEPLVSDETGTVAKADGRTITEADVKAEIQTPADGTETYTYTMKTMAGAKYQKTGGAGSQPAEGAWGDTKEFTGLVPGQSYTFHAYMPATEEYEAGNPVSFTIAFPKLTHKPLTLAYTVEDSGDKKKVTITVPAGGGSYEYTFDGETWSSASEANVKDECEADEELTIGIRYAASDVYESQLEQTLNINVGKEAQTAPSAATLTVQPNDTKTAYDIEVTEPSAGAGTLEYSTDGKTFTTLDQIQTTGLAAGATFTLYVRLAGTDDKNPSAAMSATVTTPTASETPTIKGAGDATTFTNNLEVTLAAGAGATIYYTTDGSAPAIGGDTYSSPITVSATTTIKAIAVENGKIMSAVASQTFTKQSSGGSDTGSGSGSGSGSSGGGSGSSSSGSGSTGTENKPETGTETKPNDTQVETSTGTNASGNTVEVTTTTKTDSTGAVTSIIEKSVIAESSSTTSTTVTVKKNGEGEITSATASIANTVESGNKATVSAALVSQITEAAGTDDVKITMTVKDADGSTKYKIKVDADNLQAGEDLYLYKLNTKTGEYVMVNAKTYGVSKSGSVSVSIKNKATYELVDAAQSARITKQIKSTIKPQKASASIKKNKKTTFALSKKANKSNVKSITYTTSKKSVATVSKSGKISAKGKGTAIVKAKVTLKNGATKTIKMTIKVK